MHLFVFYKGLYVIENYTDKNFNIFNFILSFLFLISITINIYGIYNNKKWSWLVSVVFSFYFLMFYGQLLIISINILSSTNLLLDKSSILSIYSGFTYSNFVIPFIMFFILILLFRPIVKEYFKQESYRENNIIKQPKSVKTLIFLWILSCFCILIQCWYYYNEVFFSENVDITFYGYFSNFIETNIYLIIIIVIIFGIINVKKWIWLVNVVFSFYFFMSNIHNSFTTLNCIIFSSDHQKEFSSNYSYTAYTYSVLFLTIIMLIILILLLRPNVSKYFNEV